MMFIVDLAPLSQAGHSQRIVEAVAILFDVIEKVDQSSSCPCNYLELLLMHVFVGEVRIKSYAQVHCV